MLKRIASGLLVLSLGVGCASDRAALRGAYGLSEAPASRGCEVGGVLTGAAAGAAVLLSSAHPALLVLMGPAFAPGCVVGNRIAPAETTEAN